MNETPPLLWRGSITFPGAIELTACLSWRLLALGVGLVIHTAGRLEFTLGLPCLYLYLDIPAAWARSDADEDTE